MKYNKLRTTLLVVMLLFAWSKSYSQVITPFTNIYQATQKGGIVYLSNSAIGCATNPPTSGGACQTGVLQTPPGGTYRDNSFNGVYIDVDGDPTTFMSSKDSLNLPACSQVTKAFLFWGASGATTPNRTTIKMKVGSGSYQTVTAVYSQTNNVGFNTYHCYADVTSLVQTGGIKSRITVADIPSNQATGSNSNIFGSWNLVVFYSNDLLTMRQLTIFNGLANVADAAGQRTVNIPFSGFLTPTSGPVTLELGVYVHDGDRGLTGDNLSFNGGSGFVAITDAVNSSNDIMNSTVSYNGVLTPFRIPNMNNTAGLDADIFVPNNAAKNYVGNSVTSATFQMTTSSETYLPQMITTAIDVYEPDLRASIKARDVNGGLVVPGDIIEYKIKGINIGSDPSINTFITDTLDVNALYIPNSTKIVYGANIGSKTDVGGDDQVDYNALNRTIKVRIGNGANAVSGGTVQNSPAGIDSTIVTYSVMVTSSCVKIACTPSISARTFIWGTGAVSSNTFNNGSNPGIFDAFGCPIPGTTSSPITATMCGVASATNNGPGCIGSSVVLSSPPDTEINYLWAGPLSFTSAIQNPTLTGVTSGMAGVYTVTMSVPGSTCQSVLSTTLTTAVCTPTAVNDATTTILNTPVLGNVATNDLNVSSATFSLLVQPSGGTVTINSSTGQFTFTPSSTFTGVTTSTYSACNGTNCATANISFTVFPALLANPDIINTTPSVTTTGSLLTNDSGIVPSIGGTYSVSVTQPSSTNGTITINPTTGQYTFIPNPAFTGTFQTTYTVCNTAVNPQVCSSSSITINVLPNPAPVNDATTTVINTPISGSAATNDGGTVAGTFSITGQPANGTISINPSTGQYTFTPATSFTGVTTGTYNLCNGAPTSCSNAVISATVFPNILANGDVIVTTPTLNATGTLVTNDAGYSPTLGATYSISVTQPSASTGTITVNPTTGQYTFAPNPSFTGTTTTTYTICNTSVNPQQCSNATITITIVPSPLAVNDATNTAINTSVTGNASTNDSGILTGTYVITSQPISTSGTVSINPNTGIYTFTPATGFTGTAQATYQLCNAVSPPCATANINFTVYPNISAIANTLVTTPSVATTGSLLANDIGIVAGAVYSVSVTQPAAGVGTITLNSATGQYTFNPNPAYTGSVNTSYTVCNTSINPQQCSNTTITIIVGNPPAAVNDATNTVINTVVTGNAGTNDVGVPTGTFAISNQPANGTISINATTGVYSFTPATGFTGITTATYQLCNVLSPPCSNAMITFSVYPNLAAVPNIISTTPSVAATGSLLANDTGILTTGTLTANYSVTIIQPPASTGTIVVNPTTGQYTFNPNPSFTGVSQATYNVCNISVNPQQCSTTTITINVIPAPIAVNDATNTIINTSVTGNAATNDTGVLTGTFAVTAQPANGTLTIDPATGVYSFTPALGFTGVTTATYQLCNVISVPCASASITFTVYPNLVANNDAIIVTPSVATTGTLLANDLGVIAGGNYTVNVTPISPTTGTLTYNSATGQYTFLPNPTFTGQVNTTYTVCNLSVNPVVCSNATINIVSTALAINDATNTIINTPVTGNASTNDLNAVGGTYTITGQPASGTITMGPNGAYSFTPTAGFTGITTATYQLCNGSPVVCTNATINFTVYPTIIASPDIINTIVSVNATGTLTTNDLGAASVSTLGGTYSVNITQPPASTGTLVVNPTTGGYLFIPNPTFSGSTTTTYTICNTSINPQQCSNTTVTINVVPPPIAVNDGTVTTSTSSVVGDVSINDTGVLTGTFSIINPSNDGTLAINPTNGNYTFVPTPGFTGTTQVIYQLCNFASPPCATAAIVFTVYPSVLSNTSTTFANTSVVGDASASNTPSTGLTYGTPTVVGASNGTLVISANGSYTFIPATAFTGTTQYIVSVCNNTVAPPVCSTDTIVIDVIPALVPETLTVTNGSSVSGNVLSNEPGTIPTTGSVNTTPVSGPNHGTFTITPSGTFTYTSTDPNFVGYDTVRVTVCIGSVCSTNTIIITVYPNLKPNTSTTFMNNPVVGNAAASNTPSTGLTYGTPNVVGTSQGTMVVSANGNYTFTPAPGFTGTTQYVVSVCNNSVTPPICKNDTININVIPGLNPETLTLTAGSNVTGNVMSNEPSGIQNGTVTITPISGPNHGSITISPNGNFTYTATNPNYSGYDTVLVTICVGTVCATNTIMITVYPNLGNDSGSNTPGGTVTGNVLDNDHGTGLTINTTPITNPSGGTVVLNPNGTYVYTPNTNYCGLDSFAYQACDISVPPLCKTAWVYITIPCEDVVSVPEGFSPNGDGTNDVLVVKGISKYPDNKIVIFNRWGNVVFEGNADLNKWDGKSNAGTKIGGDDLPVGTYFYILDLKTDGKKNLKGYIYLQR